MESDNILNKQKNSVNETVEKSDTPASNKKKFRILLLVISFLIFICIAISFYYFLNRYSTNYTYNSYPTAFNTSAPSPTIKIMKAPPKLTYKLPKNWEFRKKDIPIINEVPLSYGYGGISNSELSSSKSAEKYTGVGIIFYQNGSGYDKEGIHGGGNALKYEKPEEIKYGNNLFIRQISYSPTIEPNYEGEGQTNPDIKQYTYSLATKDGYIKFFTQFNINNPNKNRILNDIEYFLSTIKVDQ